MSLVVPEHADSDAEPVAKEPATAEPVVTVSPREGLIRVAGLTALGAGAIHAAAIGSHAEHAAAATTFTILAAIQLAWGAFAIMRPTRPVALVGAVVSVAAVGGWLFAKIWGIWFIDGLDVAEAAGTADGLCAGLTIGTAMLLIVALLPMGAAPVSKEWSGLMPIAGVSVIVLTVVAMVAAGNHTHAHGEEAAGHTHTASETAAHDDGSGHTHTAAGTTGEASSTSITADPTGSSSGSGHSHASQAVAAKPYDPTKPIDLGGVDGVTPEQQAAAENLVARTVYYLPQWTDPAVAEAAGFHSIGDGFTGVEHFVNQTFMDDEVNLDPNRPESLVYDTTGGGRRLVAAMFMVKRGTPLDQVPDIGGKLMQWHTHENLCYNADGKVQGLTNSAGDCPDGLVKPQPTPMIHVWIEPHRCGPFAALEGVGGGTIKQGEAVLCDHVHGSS